MGAVIFLLTSPLRGSSSCHFIPLMPFQPGREGDRASGITWQMGKQAPGGQEASPREHGLDPRWALSPLGFCPHGSSGLSPSPAPSSHPSCAGELAGLRQQMTTVEEKAALDKELMAQKLVQAEREAQASLREQRAAHEEDLERLQREKVRAAGWGRQGSEPVSPL